MRGANGRGPLSTVSSRYGERPPSLLFCQQRLHPYSMGATHRACFAALCPSSRAHLAVRRCRRRVRVPTGWSAAGRTLSHGPRLQRAAWHGAVGGQAQRCRHSTGRSGSSGGRNTCRGAGRQGTGTQACAAAAGPHEESVSSDSRQGRAACLVPRNMPVLAQRTALRLFSSPPPGKCAPCASIPPPGPCTPRPSGAGSGSSGSRVRVYYLGGGSAAAETAHFPLGASASSHRHAVVCGGDALFVVLL
jgi:hypothetical protein